MARDCVRLHTLIPPGGALQRSVPPRFTRFTNSVFLKVPYYTSFDLGGTPRSDFIPRTLEISRRQHI